mgnify:CR=1 FL=1
MVWLALLALTAVTYAVGEAGLTGIGPMLAVLAIALIKGRLVAWHFMELRHVRPLWRSLLAGWLLVVGAGIATAFLTAAT